MFSQMLGSTVKTCCPAVRLNPGLPTRPTSQRDRRTACLGPPPLKGLTLSRLKPS